MRAGALLLECWCKGCSNGGLKLVYVVSYLVQIDLFLMKLLPDDFDVLEVGSGIHWLVSCLWALALDVDKKCNQRRSLLNKEERLKGL